MAVNNLLYSTGPELIIRLKLREKNLIYTPQEKYIRCDAQFPGTPSPISILEAPFPTLRVRFCLPFRSFAISSTPTWCPPHVPKTEGKPEEKKSRKQSQEGMLREHKTAKNHLPRTTLSGWLLVYEH